MAVRLRGNSWIVYWKEEGRQKEKSFGSGDVGKFKAEKHNESIGLGTQNRQDSNAVPFMQFVDEFLNHLKAITLRKESVNNVASKFSGTILPFFGAHDIYALIHSDLDDYVNHRKSQKAKNKKTPPKNSSINREIDDIQTYLNWCVTNEKIIKNPLRGFKRPSKDSVVTDPPSINEVNLMIKYSVSHLQRFISLAYYIGARPGAVELLSLKWDQVSWDKNQIIIRSADKKGLNSRRISIKRGFLELLKEWHLQDKNNMVPVDYIVHWNGKRIKRISSAFNGAKRRAGITRTLTPYDIRHSHVTHQLDMGADLKAVSSNIGHKSPDTTMKVYQHTSGKLQREAIELLPDLKLPEINQFLKKKKG